MADEKKPDTSSFVEHLRLVHLTLVLTCVISIIALWSQEMLHVAPAKRRDGDE
jgi:hypothetical protein